MDDVPLAGLEAQLLLERDGRVLLLVLRRRGFGGFIGDISGRCVGVLGHRVDVGVVGSGLVGSGSSLVDVRLVDGRLDHVFSPFILTEIFPGGWLPTIPVVEERARKAGFDVIQVQSLQLHYAKTLDLWAGALRTKKAETIAIQSQEVYDRYMST